MNTRPMYGKMSYDNIGNNNIHRTPDYTPRSPGSNLRDSFEENPIKRIDVPMAIQLSPSYVNPGNMIDEVLYDNLWNGKFYPVRLIHDRCEELLKVDYSVIASRREGHQVMVEFVERGLVGHTVFDDHVRFRENDRGDLFVPDVDLNFFNIIVSLTGVLSYRDTNQAKDTKAAISSGRLNMDEPEKVTILKDAGNQDHSKRFEELLKQLKTYARPGTHTYNRHVFEMIVAKWA